MRSPHVLILGQFFFTGPRYSRPQQPLIQKSQSQLPHKMELPLQGPQQA